MRWLTPLLFLPIQAQALELFLRDSVPMPFVSSLEFDPALCGVWIANEGREVVFMGPSGEITRRFETTMFTAKALTVEGDNLLVADGTGRFERMTKEGEKLGEPYRMPGAVWDVEGIVSRPGGELVLSQDDNARVWSLDADGKQQWEINGFGMQPPMVEPQGIAFDRRTGALYVVDDREGSNSVFEFAPDGTLLATVSLAPYGIDPEGIAIQADTGTMWIAFDVDGKLATFDYLPTLREEDADATSDACLMF
ncbi:MAG: hypothetical protein AAGA15_02415 [Pseudomonadota bacterium]